MAGKLAFRVNIGLPNLASLKRIPPNRERRLRTSTLGHHQQISVLKRGIEIWRA